VSAHGLSDKIHFFGQVFDVLGASPMIFGDDLVTSTVVANVRAKRQMKIQGNWFLMSGTSLQSSDVVGLIELRIESIGRWVRRVTGSIDVKALQELWLKQWLRTRWG
jgi:hypothetical protein